MAKGRMLNKNISQSKKFNLKLKDDFHRLVYCMILPHTDRDGRLEGMPYYIKSIVFPWREDVSIKKIETALKSLDEVGLIKWYSIDDEKYIQITQFNEGQTGMRYEREPESTIPPFDGHDTPKKPEDNQNDAGKKPEKSRKNGEKVSTEKNKKRIRKEKNINTQSGKHKFGEFQNVLLTDKNVCDLNKKFGEHKTQYLINLLDTKIQQKGYKYKDFYLTILDWEKRDTDYKPPAGKSEINTSPQPPKICPVCKKGSLVSVTYGAAVCSNRDCRAKFNHVSGKKWEAVA